MNETFLGRDYTVFGTTGVIIKPRAGRLAKVVVTTTVVGNLTFFDNPAAGSGTVLCVLSAPAAGPPVVIDVPAKTGIFLTPGTAGAGIVVWS